MTGTEVIYDDVLRSAPHAGSKFAPAAAARHRARETSGVGTNPETGGEENA
jgi:hypothetical protein